MQRRNAALLGALCLVPLLAVAACAGGGANTNTSSGTQTKLTFALDFIADGRYAPFYLALKEGYYSKAGLNVNIIGSKGSAAVLQDLTSGNAQIGYDDLSAFLLGQAGGAKMTMVSVQYQKAPYAVYSLKPGANVSMPGQLAGLTVTSNAGSFTPNVIKGFMAQQGLDPSRIKFNDVDPSTKNALLMSGKVSAIETYIMSQPALDKAAPSGKSLVTFLLADHGLKLYGNGIIVPDSYLKSHGDVVRKFVKASLLGWRDAIRDPQAAANAVMQYLPTLDPGVTLKQVEIVNGLALTPYTKQHGLGTMDPAEMNATYQFVEKYGGLTGNTLPPLSDVYSADYLPSAPILP